MLLRTDGCDGDEALSPSEAGTVTGIGLTFLRPTISS